MHLPKFRSFTQRCGTVLTFLTALSGLSAQTPTEPTVSGITVKSGQKVIQFKPHPGAEQYQILSAPGVNGPFQTDSSGSFSGNTWTSPLTAPIGFYKLSVKEISTNDLLVANLLHRLGYGPTPDELERVKAMGPQAYINEQLAPETVTETLPFDSITVSNTSSGWQYFTASGTGSSSKLYIYMNLPGEGHIDDIKFVAGNVAEAGANMIRNGDFESPLAEADWAISPNHARSAIDTTVFKSGKASLKIVATAAGSTDGSAIVQTITPALSTSARYTLSYWFLPSTNKLSSITLRLSNRGIESTPIPLPSLLTRIEMGAASLDEYRSWHIQRAIRSKRQLLEVLLQFLENHFVTEQGKTRDYLDRYYNDGTQMAQLATWLEYTENKRWRAALLNPLVTFHDLLKISTESPAMIIYLDTVDSKGNGNNIANENYARELLELFTFGVDNGYDQNDIVEMSKVWTGWGVNIVDDPKNPFSLRTTNRPPGTANQVSNLVGTWSFVYKPENHNNKEKVIFPGKTVPERFGPPWAGKNYELKLPVRTGTPNGGTNGIKDGYEAIAHLADLPFTQEYLSVKLCRLLVHDDFATGYDFTDPNLSPEGRLIHQCMQAWESGSPKGQIRKVLATIIQSDLFRTHNGAAQKVKTPLEFTVSAIRALSSENTDGTFTAVTDGNFASALNRMGGMKLFDRAEPDGYPESGPPWISAGTLSERLRFIQAYLIAPGQRGSISDVSTSTSCDPVSLLKKKLPVASHSNAAAVADYFINILYPAEGRANLDAYRTLAINFLNTADNGTTASLFSSLATTAANYDTRVRGMVAMLMTLPRFQEQ